MKSHSFFASGDQLNYCSKVVSNDTGNPAYRQNQSDESAVSDSSLRSCALKLAQQGQFSRAIALLSQLIDRRPDDAVNYSNRGLIYFQCGEREKAESDYNKALQLDPNLASAYNNRANYYAACGELAAALADYDHALDLNPGYVRAWINRGITLRDLGQYSDAIDNFEVALLFEELEGNIIAERGRTYHLWGEWNCAIADYNRALNLLPLQNINSINSSGRLRSQVDNWLNQLLHPQNFEWIS